MKGASYNVPKKHVEAESASCVWRQGTETRGRLQNTVAIFVRYWPKNSRTFCLLSNRNLALLCQLVPLTFICTGQFDKRSHGLEQSLERSPASGDFYGTGIEIWAGLGPVRQLLRPFFFMFSWAKNIFQIFFSTQQRSH